MNSTDAKFIQFLCDCFITLKGNLDDTLRFDLPNNHRLYFERTGRRIRKLEIFRYQPGFGEIFRCRMRVIGIPSEYDFIDMINGMRKYLF